MTGAGAPAASPTGTSPTGASTAGERAARLLRWYPRAWRDRYGAEFAELLVSDIEERPRSATRTLDVARGGIMARLAGVGLAGGPLPPASAGAATAQAHHRQASASLGSLGCVLAIFVTFGAAIWSQVVIARQWMSPASGAGLPPHAVPASAVLATDAMSVAILALLALAVLAALPVLCAIVARFAAHRHAGLTRPAVALLASATFLFSGGRHFENGWPGTGGHGSFVPSGLAAFEWATSMSVSAYWAHPGRLATFPGSEVSWMAVTPLALAVALAATVVLVRRAALSARMLAIEARLAVLACAFMTAFLGAAAWWVATTAHRPVAGLTSPFAPGLVDVASTAVLAVALAVAIQAARMTRRGLRLARS